MPASAGHVVPGHAPATRRFPLVAAASRLPRSWTAARLLDLYGLLLLTRALDERQSILTRQGRQGIHLSARGHEASGAGSALALDPARDILVPSHRSLAAVLAWGISPAEVLLQCLSKASDPASGGRSMPNHYGHRGRRVLSMSSPIGTQLPHAAGAALASTIRGQDAVVLAFFGDGASSKADCHEALNFAARYRPPQERARSERRDPLPRFARRLERWGVLDEQAETGLIELARARVDEALTQAEAATEPHPRTALLHVWA